MIEIFGTIPLASWVLSLNAKAGFVPWVGFAALHQDFDLIYQIPSVVWKNYHISHVLFEFYRWSLVACAFTFFGFFGFADEARRHYRLVYTSLASRVGLSTSNGKFAGSSHGTSSFPGMSSKGAGVSVTISRGQKRDSTISITDQLSIPSIAYPGDMKSDFKIEPFTTSETTASSSVSSLEAELYDPSSESTATPVLPVLPPSTYSSDVRHVV